MRTVLQFVVRALCVFLVLPTLCCLMPFCKIRFGLLYTRRIGHLSGNTDLFLRKQQIFGIDSNTVFVLAGIDPANRQLFEMFKRSAPVYESRWLTRILSYARPILRRTPFWEDVGWRDPEYETFGRGKATLTFTEEEEKRGRTFLKTIGIGENDWFVCLHARDPRYLDAHLPGEQALWRTRDFRNCRIENYLEAAEYITSRGGWVLRMGALVDAPLPDTGNPRIVDYATKHRSDFLDIYLPARCRFFIGSDSGLFVVSTIFDVPVALANLIFVGLNPFQRCDLFILKRLRERTSGRILPLDEAIKLGFYTQSAKHPEAQDYEFVDNEPDEILDLVREMIERLEGREANPHQTVARDAFRKKYRTTASDYEHAPDLCWRFAVKHRDLIETRRGIARAAMLSQVRLR